MDFEKSKGSTDERPARPRMTGTVIRTSEVSPTMTGDGHPYLGSESLDARAGHPSFLMWAYTVGTSWGFFDKLLMQKGQKP